VIADLESKDLIDNSGSAAVMWSLGKPTAEQLASEERTTPPLILRKSDGGYGYDSTDMTAVHYRVKTMKMDWVIYVVDSGQSVHFKQVFEGAKMAGWLQDDTRLEHINFGVVCGDDKKRLRTSAGVSVRLVDLLNAAVDHAQEQIEDRIESGACQLSEEEVMEAAETLGYGSVKVCALLFSLLYFSRVSPLCSQSPLFI